MVLLVLLQIGLGGFVAGLRAGHAFNTWPLIDGYFGALDKLTLLSPLAEFSRQYFAGPVPA
jgi:cytochrome c oxidase assembly protein subunit 15